GNVTEIASLPLDLDELQIRNARVKLDVAAVPPLVVDNSTVELTVPSVSELTANNASIITLNAGTVTALTLDGSKLSQSTVLTVSNLTLQNSSTWYQDGYDLTVSDTYAFTNSHFDHSGAWNRPEGSDLTVTGYTMTLPSGTHQYGTLTIGTGGKIKVSPYNETTEQGGRLTLDVNELVVAEGGVLSASGAG
ncbi:hypothetical protein, partial [Marinobacter arenosus]|uniref:hypothetical protein n=1 Tax=Marinobacter arenosus TaxID=2856822 RepID=UPI001C4DB351